MKEKEIVFQSVGDYDDFNQHPKLHPLVSVIDFSKAAERYGHRMQFHFYAVMLKDVRCGDTRYGKQTYDYQEGTLVFIAPDQMLDVMDKSELYQPKGYALAFHPDLLVGTSLRRTIASYGFFAYDCHEALHISAEERAIVRDCLAKIEKELGSRYDKHSDKVIVVNIELLLSYCSRFYERQFRMRTKVHQRTVQRLEALIEDYFTNGKSEELGLPTVAYCAEQLHFSANYLGDLIKRETGSSAQEFIQELLIAKAKTLLADKALLVSEVAYRLGFKYPQHFSRFFKQQTGVSPREYHLSK